MKLSPQNTRNLIILFFFYVNAVEKIKINKIEFKGQRLLCYFYWHNFLVSKSPTNKLLQPQDGFLHCSLNALNSYSIHRAALGQAGNGLEKNSIRPGKLSHFEPGIIDLIRKIEII